MYFFSLWCSLGSSSATYFVCSICSDWRSNVFVIYELWDIWGFWNLQLVFGCLETQVISSFTNTINNILQLRFAGSQWLRKDYVAQLYRRSATTEHWTNLCSRWKTWNKRQWSARKTCWIHASGECLYKNLCLFFQKFNVEIGWTT